MQNCCKSRERERKKEIHLTCTRTHILPLLRSFSLTLTLTFTFTFNKTVWIDTIQHSAHSIEAHKSITPIWIYSFSIYSTVTIVNASKPLSRIRTLAHAHIPLHTHSWLSIETFFIESVPCTVLYVRLSATFFSCSTTVSSTFLVRYWHFFPLSLSSFLLSFNPFRSFYHIISREFG